MTPPAWITQALVVLIFAGPRRRQDGGYYQRLPGINPVSMLVEMEGRWPWQGTRTCGPPTQNRDILQRHIEGDGSNHVGLHRKFQCQ
jgi:hypothetical protein